MSPPVVSIVLATRNRPRFLRLALRYYAWQTQPDRELIVVDDSATPANIKVGMGVRHIILSEETPLGTKLNLGVDACRGRIVVKMDDDDYYAHDFLARMVTASLRRPTSAISFLQPFLFFDLNSFSVRCADAGRCSGATLTFWRELWEQQPFRNTPCAVDADFLLDHGIDARDDSTFTRVSGIESFLQVRHRKHTWNQMPWGESVEHYVARMPLYSKPIDALIPAWVERRYRELARDTA